MAYWAATQLQPHRERVAELFLRQFGLRGVPAAGAPVPDAVAPAHRIIGRRTFPDTASPGSSFNGMACASAEA
jgi:hypothetical protein